MKIFPPLTEIIWPPGLSARDALWTRRNPLGLIAVLVAAALAWSLARPGNIAGTRNASLIEVPGTECSSLQFNRSASAITGMPCKTFRMKPGASIVSGRTLSRAPLPQRPTQLTAADRAIQPPARFRPSLSGQASAAPPRAAGAPAIALSPATK